MNTNNPFPIKELKARIEWLKNNVPIYPLYRKQEVAVKEEGWEIDTTKITFDTLIRIEREGIYYIVRIRFEHIITDTISNTKELLIESIVSTFHKKVYEYYILCKVDPNVIDTNGNTLFTVDTDQRSEEERLRELLIF